MTMTTETTTTCRGCGMALRPTDRHMCPGRRWNKVDEAVKDLIASEPKTTNGPTDEDLFTLAKKEWREVKPSEQAQKIRALICNGIDTGKHLERDFDYVPDYVWLLIDIAAQRGLDAR